MRSCSRMLILTMLLIAFGCVFAQQTREAVVGDQINLQVNNPRGTFQWQQSPNGNTWTNISGATTNPYNATITSLPVHFRCIISESDCQPVASEIVHVDIKKFLWSNPASWGGVKPVAGQHVTIPAGAHYVLDENPPALGSLTINGTLEFKRQDLALTAAWILVKGTFMIGTESVPFEQKATITLNSTNTTESIQGMGTRGIMVMGGTLEFHGATYPILATKLNQHANAGAKNFTLSDAVTWKPGDQIIIGPTDFYLAANQQSVTQQLTIATANSTQVSTQESINAFRWGLLQYATTTGISLTPQNLVTPPLPDTETLNTPRILDERAPVANLTRNIVIQAPQDELWTNQGFGCHVKIMGPQSTAHVEGVEIRRAGQRNRLGRYPFHWHMLSYSGSQTLADATGQYLKRSSIHNTSNRGIVVHGTNGVLIKDNVVFNVRGHGIFTEDAVERRNVFDGNLVLRVRNPQVSPAVALKQHEVGERGSSGFWISNPDNIVINNTAADCQTNGFWLAFTTQPWGESSSVLHTDGLLLNPSRLLFGVFDNNTAHSNGMEGIMLDRVEIDNFGTTREHPYISTTNGRSPTWNSGTMRRFTLSNYKVWKNLLHGIWDRGVWATNTGVVSADNCNRFFAGSGADGLIERSLVVGTSLNHMMNNTNRTPHVDSFGGTEIPAAFATYHSAFDIKHNIVMHFPITPNKRSGAFATEDYYTIPVDKGQYRNVGNLLIDAYPGVRVLPVLPHYNLVNALWDPYGIWGPAGNFFVYDNPFLTHGLPVTVVPPGPGSGGVSVPGPFYGFHAFVLHGVGDTPPQNQPYMDLMGIHVKRLDQSLNVVGTWTVAPAVQGQFLDHMRSFATHPTGIYELTFPQETIHPTNFRMDVDNMLEKSDKVVMSIQYDGTKNARVRMQSYSNRWVVYEEKNSLDEVRQFNGPCYWQDSANNKVWVKIEGGFWQYYTTSPTEPPATNDELLYEPTQLYIYPAPN